MAMLSCVVRMSRFGRKVWPSRKAQLGLSLYSATGKGYIGGTVSFVDGEEPDFNVHTLNDLGLPDDVCQDLLLMAYAVYGPAVSGDNARTVHRISSFGAWLTEWFKRPAALGIAQQLEEALAYCRPHAEGLAPRFGSALKKSIGEQRRIHGHIEKEG